jgi:hypothetical protein
MSRANSASIAAASVTSAWSAPARAYDVQATRERVRFVAVTEVVDDDGSALVVEAVSDRVADPAAGASDERDLAVKFRYLCPARSHENLIPWRVLRRSLGWGRSHFAPAHGRRMVRGQDA